MTIAEERQKRIEKLPKWAQRYIGKLQRDVDWYKKQLAQASAGDDTDAWHPFHPTTRKLVEINPEQLWFWTPEWQAGERMVEEDLRLGRYEDFDSIDDLLACGGH